MDRWEYVTSQPSSATVLPDGCQDLIVRWEPRKPPCWFITEIDSVSRSVAIDPEVYLLGYRLRPGCQIDERRLIQIVRDFAPDNPVVLEAIDRCTHLDPRVDEALSAIASSTTVEEAAARTGVGLRTLQRLISDSTGRPPKFWSQLARVRHVACVMENAHSLATLAYDLGFSDQSHLNRQFKRWFGVPPCQFASTPSLVKMAHQPGYG